MVLFRVAADAESEKKPKNAMFQGFFIFQVCSIIGDVSRFMKKARPDFLQRLSQNLILIFSILFF